MALDGKTPVEACGITIQGVRQIEDIDRKCK